MCRPCFYLPGSLFSKYGDSLVLRANLLTMYESCKSNPGLCPRHLAREYRKLSDDLRHRVKNFLEERVAEGDVRFYERSIRGNILNWRSKDITKHKNKDLSRLRQLSPGTRVSAWYIHSTRVRETLLGSGPHSVSEFSSVETVDKSMLPATKLRSSRNICRDKHVFRKRTL